MSAVFIGNSIFGDDRIGLYVGDRLREQLERRQYDVQVIERTGFALLDCLEGYDTAVIVDSFSNGEIPVGAVNTFSVEDFGLVKPPSPHYSGVPEALALMKELEMPIPKVRIIGINVRNPYALSDKMDQELDAVKATVCSDVLEGILSHAVGS